MNLLICSIGSKQRSATLHFGAAVAKALSARTTFLGIVAKEQKAADLRVVMEQAALELLGEELVAEIRVEVGKAEDMILAEAERGRYDLVALGALGRKRSRRAWLDSVGMQLIERAEGSVLLIKGNRRSLSHILICASGAELGHMPVWAGAAVACGAGARATLLHVADAMPSIYVGLERMDETLAELLQSETDMARELKWAAQVVKAECELSEVKLRHGIVAEEILQESQEGDYDLIVLGSSRSAGGLVRALMGDVTREVVDRAQRPVLVVRPTRQ